MHDPTMNKVASNTHYLDDSQFDTYFSFFLFRRALSQHKRPTVGKREIHRREGVIKTLLYNDGNRLFVKVTLWTLVGVITAAGLSWLNSYYVQDYHS
jgi:hypothetical protein